MAKPNWTPTLAQVLQHKTEKKEFVSPKTGKSYETDVIPELTARVISLEKSNTGGFVYSILDEETNLEYEIKLTDKITVKRFGTVLFHDVRGGQTSRGQGWYKAESVEVV